MEIIDYPNYLIYRDGKVFSKYTNKFMKEQTHKDGYKQIKLCKDGKSKLFLIHRLIGIHYLPNAENKETIDHINRNRSDNRVQNLQWATRKEQQENTGIRKEYCINKNNTSGHKGICFHKSNKKWIFQKQGKNKIHKYFKTKIDCLCFKFYWILKNNLNRC